MTLYKIFQLYHDDISMCNIKKLPMSFQSLPLFTTHIIDQITASKSKQCHVFLKILENVKNIGIYLYVSTLKDYF